MNLKFPKIDFEGIDPAVLRGWLANAEHYIKPDSIHDVLCLRVFQFHDDIDYRMLDALMNFAGFPGGTPEKPIHKHYKIAEAFVDCMGVFGAIFIRGVEDGMIEKKPELNQIMKMSPEDITDEILDEVVEFAEYPIIYGDVLDYYTGYNNWADYRIEWVKQVIIPDIKKELGIHETVSEN